MILQILKEYGLADTPFEAVPVNNGLINTTWKIQSANGDFILQKINIQVFKNPFAIAANVRMLADYLSHKYPDYLFIAPVRTSKNAEMVFLDGEGYFRLFPYVKKSHTIDSVQIPAQAFEAAKAFGQFTRLLSQFTVERLQITLPDFHNLSLRYKQFSEALINGNKKRLEQSHKLIKFIKEHKTIVETYVNILHNPLFKLRVTHHDTKISNILFNENDQGLCVIDLDTIMPGYFISDIGDMMRTYLSPVSEEESNFAKIEIREEYFTAIWKGYNSEMNAELTNEEKKDFIYAGKFMIYMQAIRFLTDHLGNDIYYGAKYEGQNFVRAGNQIILLQRLMEKEEMLQGLLKVES